LDFARRFLGFFGVSGSRPFQEEERSDGPVRGRGMPDPNLLLRLFLVGNMHDIEFSVEVGALSDLRLQ
jgi:hypothetical protein